MSSPLACCNTCATTETVNVPGNEGDPGLDGTNGVDAFTHLTEGLLIPAEGNSITIGVESSVWMVVGQILIIGEGVIPSDAPNGWANFQVTGIPSAVSVTLTSLQYPGDTPDGGGATLASGATVSPAGLIGPTGP
jgi:hypothetical protein